MGKATVLRTYSKNLLTLFMINLSISCLIWLLTTEGGFWFCFVYANCIGCCSWGLTLVLLHFGPSRLSVLQAHLLTLPLGLVTGLLLAALLGYPQVLNALLTDSEIALRSLLLYLLLGGAGATLMFFRYQSMRYQAELASQQRQFAEHQQAETLAHLKLLQAQIEPHFLFNTLANVHSLIGFEPAKAQQMLAHLDGYLRASLQRTRQPLTTLAQELELVQNLLAIAKIRLAERLQYRLTIDSSLLTLQLPPLLLQPLVENALFHGIEPKVAGGTIEISVSVSNNKVQLQVNDDGSGLNAASASHGGVGLENIRQRLFRLYGNAARLDLYQLNPTGCSACLSLPLQWPAPSQSGVANAYCDPRG